MEGFRTGFREFSVLRNSRNSSGTNQLFRLFRLPRKIFFVGNANPRGRGEGGWGGNKLMVYFEMHKKEPGKKRTTDGKVTEGAGKKKTVR